MAVRERTFTSAWVFLLLSGLCQLVGFGAGLTARQLGAGPWVFLAAHGIAAFLLARFLRLPRPWQIFNLILPPGALLTAQAALPAWLPAAAVLLTALIFAPTFWTRVPFYPTSKQMYEVIAEHLPDGRDFTFIDLGCGFGTLLMHLARVRPRGRYRGVEIGLLPYLIAKCRAALGGRGRIEISLKSFWNLPLGGYNYVYAFLAPPPMPRLWEKARRELKPGAVFLVNSFPAPAKADSIQAVDDRRACKLYLYRIK